MAELGNKDLSGRVIEAAIRVHKELSPGFIESVYETDVPWRFDVKRSPTGRASPPDEPRFTRRVRPAQNPNPMGDWYESALCVELPAAGISDGIMLNFYSMPLTIRRIAPEQSGAFSQSS